MDPDRRDNPSALEGVVLEVPPKEGLSLYRELIERLEGEMKQLLLPAHVMNGNSSSEAGARAMKCWHDAFFCKHSYVSDGGRGEHG